MHDMIPYVLRDGYSIGLAWLFECVNLHEWLLRKEFTINGQ